MGPEEISSHLARYREQQESAAAELKARLEKEELLLARNHELCEATVRDSAWPILEEFAALLSRHHYESTLHPVQKVEQITGRTQLRKTEYSAALSIERPKGVVTLRIAASPHDLRFSSSIGIPHGNYNSVVTVESGPLHQAAGITRQGIADFLSSAFPLSARF